MSTDELKKKGCLPASSAGFPDQVTDSSCCGSGQRHTIREEGDKKKLLARLKRVEGQIRGIEKMVEEDLYCPDILIQVLAATSALNSFNKVLLSNHIKGCLTNDILDGKDESVDEICHLLQKLMR